MLASVWSCDKFPTKINTLTRDYIDLWPTMATVWSTCLQQDTINQSDQNPIIFAQKGQSDIDEGDYNEFVNIARLPQTVIPQMQAKSTYL